MSANDQPPSEAPEAHVKHVPPETHVRSEKTGGRPVGENQTTDPPPYPDTKEDTDVEAERGAATGKRRWPSTLVGVLVIAIAIALVGLMVFLHLTGTLGPGGH